MNDRYFFKAKRLDNGEWVQGALLDGEKHCLIGQKIKFSPYVENECKIVGYKVDRTTLCQCTGLLDKEKNLIWENDICIYDDRAKFVVKFGEYNELIDKNNAGFYAKWENRWDGYYRKDLGYWSDLVEVIGSCFDNPELLEVE